MPATEHELDPVQVGLVRDELRRATDVGDELSRQQLQESCGIGSGDLDRVLTHLREAGAASEVVPDGWQLAGEGEPADDGEPEEEVEEPGMSLDEAERMESAGRAPIPGRPRQPQEEADDVRVEMPVAVAKSMDAPALGGIVEAGIVEAMERGSSFVLVIEP